MEKYKKSHTKTISLKYLSQTWNENFELPDGSYSVSDIQDYFEYIIRKHETVTGNSAIRIQVNKIENRITCRIKTGYYLELLTPETLKQLGSTKSKIIKEKNGANKSHLEVTEILSVHCNIVNNDYQQDLRVLHIFIPNKLFGQLLDISITKKIKMKKFYCVICGNYGKFKNPKISFIFKKKRSFYYVQ